MGSARCSVGSKAGPAMDGGRTRVWRTRPGGHPGFSIEIFLVNMRGKELRGVGRNVDWNFHCPPLCAHALLLIKLAPTISNIHWGFLPKSISTAVGVLQWASPQHSQENARFWEKGQADPRILHTVNFSWKQKDNRCLEIGCLWSLDKIKNKIKQLNRKQRADHIQLIYAFRLPPSLGVLAVCARPWTPAARAPPPTSRAQWMRPGEQSPLKPWHGLVASGSWRNH